MAGLLQDSKLFGEYIPWFQSLREKGYDAFVAQGLPTAKTEAWKYTKLRDLNTDDFVMQPSNFLAEMRVSAEECCSGGCSSRHYDCHCAHVDNSSQCSCEEHHCHDEHCHCHDEHCNCHDEHCHCHEDLSSADYELPFDAYQIHFENGRFIPPFPDFPRGVEVISLMEAVLIDEAKDYLGKVVEVNKYPLAALNTHYMEEGLYIRINRDVKLDKPIMLINHTRAGEQNLFFNLRNLIVLENNAEAEFIEWYNYSGAQKSRYFANIVNEIVLGKKAKLTHYKLQEEAFKANHISLTAVQQKADSQYHNFCLQTGANIGRNEVKVKLTDENAVCRVDAAYIMSGWATIDTTTDIEHLSPNTFSHQIIKGVVNGDARGVFQGKIHIAPNAVKTEGTQLHKALLLSDTAEIDVKPELEIFADDVKCTHGAASGELDAEQLFYMQSRGISLDEAIPMLIDAYLEDALSYVTDEAIHDWLKIATKPRQVL